MNKTAKIFFTFIVTAAGALLSGCATGNGLALHTVGPPLSQPTAANSMEGILMVYSAYEANADFNSRSPGPDLPEYSDYKILTADGKPLQKVHNDSGTILQDPVSVELSPGKYQVIARANGYGTVTVPVTIETQQSTVLHLEGDGFWPDESAFSQTNAVRLPDRQIIGWKTAANL
jgi:hypothetical protein